MSTCHARTSTQYGPQVVHTRLHARLYLYRARARDRASTAWLSSTFSHLTRTRTRASCGAPGPISFGWHWQPAKRNCDFMFHVSRPSSSAETEHSAGHAGTGAHTHIHTKHTLTPRVRGDDAIRLAWRSGVRTRPTSSPSEIARTHNMYVWMCVCVCVCTSTGGG